MTTQHPNSLRLYTIILLCLFVLCGVTQGTAANAFAQANQVANPERDRALKIYEEGKFTEAIPLLEKLSVANPNDVVVLSKLGFALYAGSRAITNADARREVLARARTVLLRANELGDHSDLSRTAIEAITANPNGDIVYSDRREVDKAMSEGEAAFAKGDYPKALAAYDRALKADPKLYEAALYMGDVYFKSEQQEKAGESFARAVSINPDRETAYRYWGDSLLKQDKKNEARDKFVEAYIAEPYNRLSAAGLVNYAQKYETPLGHPKIEIPTSVSPLVDGKMTINLDSKTLKGDDSSGAAWMMYGMSRATWPTGEFAKRFPNEKTYRHSLPEEAEALRGVAEMASGKTQGKKSQKLDASLATLVKLNEAGLLEAYVLLARPDQGIAEDYAAYRKAHGDKLRQYVVEYILTGGAGK